METMTVQRSLPTFGTDEWATLTGFLDFQRATLAVKCEGLTDAQLRDRAVPPSALSLLGLVRHMAEVEANWFRPLLGGEQMGGIWAPGLGIEVAFRTRPPLRSLMLSLCGRPNVNMRGS